MTGAAVAAADAAGAWFVLEFQVAGGAWQREPLSSCHGTGFEGALPARPFRFEKGLRSVAGWWYFATTGAHVGIVSCVARGRLMSIDLDPAVPAVSLRPYWMPWRDGGGR